MIINVSAQGDGFFTSNYSNYEDRAEGFGELPGLPGSHGLDYDVAAPLGSGLVILAGLGLGYALRRRTKE